MLDVLGNSLERRAGGLLRGARGHDARLVCNRPVARQAPEVVRLTSPAFADGQIIPDRYASPHDLSPPLAWSQVPDGAVEMLLIVQDPDAPFPRPLVHLIAGDFPPSRGHFPEGALGPGVGHGVVFGRGSLGNLGYMPPRPVRGHGPHRYVFQIFALRRALPLFDRPGLRGVLARMSAAGVVGWGRLTGTFERR